MRRDRVPRQRPARRVSRGAFSCDPTGNLVHFDRLEPAGATFSARATKAGVEFLASTDNWFRPVFLTHGPECAIYVCDMYRKTIEHPDYLPVEIRKRTDFEGGKTMGRLWRVVRNDLKPEDARRFRRVDLHQATTAQLSRTLLDPDGWRRDTAHRLLLERLDESAVGLLTAIANDPAMPAVSVVHALRLLEVLGTFEDATIRRAAGHPSAGVREHALQLIEPRLNSDPSWIDTVLAARPRGSLS